MKTSVFVGTSLDGFIARANGTFDFLHSTGAGDPGSEADAHGYDEFFGTVDAVLMGRKTYETVLPFPTWPYGQKPVVVLSTKPLKPAPAGAVVEHASGPPADIFRKLEARGFKHVYVDGGLTVQRFLQARLISRIIVARVPVLIGSGVPLFGPLDQDIRLRHVATRVYATGLVQSEYAVL